MFGTDRGPVAVPVNYRMLGDDVVFRTGEETSLAAAAARQPVSFEVDHLDDALREGWSVLVSGHAHVVSDTAELAEVTALGIAPWAGGPSRPTSGLLRPRSPDVRSGPPDNGCPAGRDPVSGPV